MDVRYVRFISVREELAGKNILTYLSLRIKTICQGLKPWKSLGYPATNQKGIRQQTFRSWLANISLNCSTKCTDTRTDIMVDGYPPPRAAIRGNKL